MEFGQLMTDIHVNVSCKFEMYIFKIAQVINENVRIAFLYVLSIYYLHSISVKCWPDSRFISILFNGAPSLDGSLSFFLWDILQ